MKMKNVNSVVTLPTHVINALAPWTHTSTLAAQARLYFPCIIEDPLVFEKKTKQTASNVRREHKCLDHGDFLNLHKGRHSIASDTQ